MHLVCPHCAAAADWSLKFQGTQVRCPSCGAPFSAADPTGDAIPVLLPADADDEVPEVIPVEESAEEVVAPPPFTPAVSHLIASPRLAQLTEHQRIVAALLIATFQEYRKGALWLGLAFLYVPPTFALGAVLFFGLQWGCAWLLGTLAPVVGDGILALQYGAPLMWLLLVGLTANLTWKDAWVAFEDDFGKVSRFKLGRLDYMFSTDTVAVMAGALGMMAGSQVALHYLMADHGGLDIEGGFSECVLVTLDNIGHGVFLDTFELYDLHFGDRVEHTWWSATVFYCYRLSYDVVVAISIYGLYQRFKMRAWLRQFPFTNPTGADLVAWLRLSGTDSGRWAQSYLDEFAFLLLTGHYLAGDYAFVRKLSESLPDLRVKRVVRFLFLDESGKGVVVTGQDPSPQEGEQSV